MVDRVCPVGRRERPEGRSVHAATYHRINNSSRVNEQKGNQTYAALANSSYIHQSSSVRAIDGKEREGKGLTVLANAIKSGELYPIGMDAICAYTSKNWFPSTSLR